MRGFDIYNHPKLLERAIVKVREDTEICEENKDDIIAFCRVKLAKGCTQIRVSKLACSLRYLARWLKKPFRTATKDDLMALVGDLEAIPDYSELTRHDYKVILKMFYKWSLGNDEEIPKVIKWLVPRVRNEASKLPEDLLTEDEVILLANTATHPRDRAFIMVLYETGCRIGEILSLQMKNVQFDQYGAVLLVTGKTGDRRVRIISSAPTLASWIEIYEKAKDPNAPLWAPLAAKATLREGGYKFLAHGCAYIMLKRLAQKAGIRKNVHPHLFRHSRATALAGKLTEAQMKEYFGWVQGSDMAATYVHLSGRDVDNALLKLHGLTRPEEEKEDKMKVRTCQRCKEHNSPIAKFCIRCGQPVDAEFITRIETERERGDNLMNKLMEDREFRELVMRKIAEPGFSMSK